MLKNRPDYSHRTVHPNLVAKAKMIGVLIVVTTGFVSFVIYTNFASAQSEQSRSLIPAAAAIKPRRHLQKNLEDIQTELPEYRAGQTTLVPEVGGVDTSFGASATEGSSRINALATQPDGKFLVGGTFSSINGVERRGIDRFNADGTRDDTFNPGGSGANSTVYVILVLPDGRIMIGGFFTNYNGSTAQKIIRLNPDGSLDPTFTPQGTSVNGGVQDMVIQPDGKILICSNFTSFNGVVRNAVARLNADGTLDTAFNPNVMNGAGGGFVEELILQPDGKIVIGGVFTTVGGTPRNSLARLNSDGTVDSSFNVGSGAQSFGGPGGVYAAERQSDGKILIGGDFDTYNGVSNNTSLARINTDGSLDTSFVPSAVPGDMGGVEFFAIQPNGKIVICGFSGFVGGPSGAGIIRLNADGSTDPTFNVGAVDDFGYVVTLQADGKILLGGLFTQFGGGERRNLVRLNQDGTSDNFACSIALDALVYSIVRQADGKLLVGGQFRRINGVARRNIARLNSDGTLDPSFDPGTGADGINTPFVYSIAEQTDGKILVGGFFGSFNGISRVNVVRLNSNGSTDSSFIYTDAVGMVRDIEVRSGGKIVLAGFFQNSVQVVNSGIVKLNSDGTYDQTAVGSGSNATVNRIIPYTDGSLKAMIAGPFTNYNGTLINRIARINDDGSLDTTFNPGTGANSAVFDVALLPNTQMYIAGAFTSFNSLANTSRIVRLNSNGSVDSNFVSGTGFNSTVFALSYEPPTDKVLAGGAFSSYNGTAINQLTLLNANGTRDTNFTAQLNTGSFNDVERLIRQPDGTVLVGGRFTGIGGVARNSIARLNATPTGSCVPIQISYGQSVNGSLNSSSCIVNGPTDLYTFTGTANQQIAISLDSLTTGGIQSSLQLVAPDGTTVVETNSGTINARIPANGFRPLPSNGSYTIRASSPSGAFGDYSLSLTLQPAAACNYTVAPASTNVNPSGGVFFFDVLSGDGCPTVTAATGANSGHITIVSNTGGRVEFSVSAYGGTTDRIGTIIVNGGPVHTITQYGVTAPNNDNFAQAGLLNGSSGTVNGRNTNATTEPNEPPHGGSAAARSVWYRWTAPTSDLYSFTTSGSTFDTVMAIYTGTSVGSLTRIAENDDTTSFDQTSKINFRAAAGTVYYIAIDGKNGQSGSIVLSYGPYRRLYRLYLQTFNGYASPISPTSVTAIRQDGTGPIINGDLISLGVYEFDLPDDSTPYTVTIAGPDGITWQPSTYTIDNSSARFNELMMGASGGGQNQTSNPTNTIPRHFFGYIHGISTQQQLTPLRVQIASTGSPSAVPPKECGPPLSTAPVLVTGGPGGAMRTLYDCLTQPNTTHQIVPNAPQTAFQVPVLELAVINTDHLPTSAEAITATASSTFNIGGRVLAGAQGLAGANVDITTAALTMRVISDSNGNYLAPNLAPGLIYTLRASLDGYVFQPETVNLQTSNLTRDITSQTCTFALTGNGNFTSGGGQGEFSVTASNSACGWTSVSGAPWISILSGSSVGNGTTQFSVQPNTGSARQGSIAVGGQNFTIIQASSCTYTLSTPSQISFLSTGGSSSFTVTTTPECSWEPSASDYCMVALSGVGPGTGTVNFSVAANQGIARSAVISIGGQSVTVSQDAADGLHRPRFDFDGDGRSDIAVYRPSDHFWYVERPGSTVGFEYTYFGLSEDIPVASDYDGDGKSDIAVFRPSSSYWYRIDSSTGAFMQQAFGATGDIPVPADYDGDGDDNIAIFRPSTGTWYTSLDPATNYGSVQWGTIGDLPAPADFDGDGRADVAVFRPSSGTWYLNNSMTGFFATQFGTAGDVPVAADYDGDGKADIAVYRPSTSIWYRLNSSSGQFIAFQFGLPGDKPVQADYNGDERVDIAVFRPSNGGWYIWSCTENTAISATLFGLSTDIPIPNPITP